MSVKTNILIREFIKNTHYIFDNIHGKKTIDVVFKGLNQNMLEDLINLYSNTFLERYYYIYDMLNKNNMFDNKPYNSTFITSMFICAIQHSSIIN